MDKVYLAATYSRHPELQNYAKDLQALGYEITSRWIWGEHAAFDHDIMGSGNAEFAGQMALEDEEGVWNSDIFIAFTEPPETNARRGGFHVETGMARALGKRLFIVGHYTNIFHRLPSRYDIFCSDTQGMLHGPVYFPDWDVAYSFFRSLATEDTGQTRT